MGTHGWAPGGGPVAWLGLGGVPAGSPRGSGAAAATGPGPRPRCGSRGPMGSGGWVRAPAPLSPASLPRWWQQGPVPPQGPRPVPHQHPRALCRPPHPSSTARRGAEAPRLGQHQNLQGRSLKSRRAVLGSGVRASTEPPLILGWVPKLRDAGPEHHPNLVAPCDRCCCCRAPNLVEKKGVRQPNQRSAEFNEFKV